MNSSIRIGAAMGGIAVTLMFIAIWPSWGMLPPLSPQFTTAEIFSHFHSNRLEIIIGGVIMSLAAPLFFLFFGAIFACMKKMEGNSTPLTSAAEMLTVFGFFPLYMLACFFIVAVYRPDQDPDTVRLMFDLGMYMLAFPALPGLVLYCVIGFCILSDKNENRIFPRWIGFVSIWVGVLSTPGCLIAFFYDGPFAWNGLFGFWLPALAFGVLINSLVYALWQAAKHPLMQR
jgi:hypothetical protein